MPSGAVARSGRSNGIADRLGRASAARRTARTARSDARRASSTTPDQARCRCAAKREPLTSSPRPQLRDEQHDEQVGDDVDDDVERRDQDRDRLHLAHVADRDRVDELLAEPGVGEEVLDDDDAADQVLEVLREDLDASARARCAARSARRRAARGSRSGAPSGRSPQRSVSIMPARTMRDRRRERRRRAA